MVGAEPVAEIRCALAEAGRDGTSARAARSASAVLRQHLHVQEQLPHLFAEYSEVGRAESVAGSTARDQDPAADGGARNMAEHLVAKDST
ncbi:MULTISPECIES: hypothetical protein [Actinomycetes]|uniref:hypothetical protein n=1 Tax=Streptomyces sp. NL15-2K TaxID=376149 RepID=UPI000FFA8EDA|nr:hypothetical protein [Kutzneria buriramensis]WKX13601.1 hypothetical protein Q4V64_41170 [Kutzneria buriramensis]GCB45004.1 hypothetical protein SNL152K_2294 [Streptomyces sp. NL15-2K]